MTSNELRARFIEFFKDRGHAVLPSASLVPENDPTVLFTTAGMHPLVPFLLGEKHPLGTRLTDAQKCLRTDDIDEVGDNRHCTFFEMLGNWSLGDYFKDEAIAWSFEFLTSEKGLNLDPQRIYVTVFAGDDDAPRDEESIAAWKQAFASRGITAEVDKPLAEGGRVFTMAKDSNWWPSGGKGVGPQGPDTEMYYDTGRDALAKTLPDGMPDFESGRLVEIWNDVFMQFNKTADGRFEPLAQQNVDTGMGLERMAMVMQDVDTIFETDLFAGIIAVLEEELPDAAADTRIRYILSDHLRASVFLIADGVRPGNKDRGYILRRLLRRSLLHAQSQSLAWVPKLVEAVAAQYGEAYPEVSSQKAEIAAVIREEAEKFHRTLEKGKAEIAKRQSLTGKDAFDLYQSYGFPLELTKEYAVGRGITLDEEEFEREFKAHQDLSRTASSGQFKSGLADHSEATVKYHTATHLLHQALRDVLGPTVQQRGSNITPERLRFDFAQPEKLTPEQLARVEEIVNAQIKAALPVSVATMSPDQAKQEGAIGLFGDKYGDSVTVYSMGTYSKEICTGPHVANTSELGHFKIAKEEAVSAGVRRIKAVLE